MAYDEIIYEVADRVATVTLNRPTKLNAWTPKMEWEVKQALQGADRDPGVRAIILTGAGRGFCAGADLQNLAALAGADVPLEKLAQLLNEKFGDGVDPTSLADFQNAFAYWQTLSKPVIAAVNGPAVGLGMVLTLFCDLRIASDEAKFGTAFSRRGLIAEYGISWMLPRIVGLSNALDLLFSARMIESQEAARMGLVNCVVPTAEFMAEVRKYAVDLANNVSPRSLKVIKQQVYAAMSQSAVQATETAAVEMLKSLASADFREGLAHFMQKRPPNFPGE